MRVNKLDALQQVWKDSTDNITIWWAQHIEIWYDHPKMSSQFVYIILGSENYLFLPNTQ